MSTVHNAKPNHGTLSEFSDLLECHATTREARQVVSKTLDNLPCPSALKLVKALTHAEVLLTQALGWVNLSIHAQQERKRTR